MRTTRHLLVASLIGSFMLGLSLPASAHGGEGRGWHDRGEWHHRHHHRDYRPSYYYGAPPTYFAPPVVYERPIVYSPPPVYAYPRRPSVVIDIPSVVIPLR